MPMPRIEPSPASQPAPQPDGRPYAVPGRPPSPVRSTGTDFETDPDADTTFPQSIHGKVLFRFPSDPEGVGRSCSGTVVSSPRRNLILSAGHCVFDAEVNHEYATDLIFIPGYRKDPGAETGNAPFGIWDADRIYTLNGWINGGGGGFAYDIGAVELEAGGSHASQIETELGARGVAFNQSAERSWQILGYPSHPDSTEPNGYGDPADPQPGDYDGGRLIGCNASYAGVDTADSLMATPCYMRQGASGGGWVTNGFVTSVTSHVFAACPADYSYCGFVMGPYFGGAAQNLYNEASGQTPPAAPPAANPTTPPPSSTATVKKVCKKKKKRKRKRKCRFVPA
jgi:hypothetical protein